MGKKMIFWVPLLAGLLNASFILDLVVTLASGDSLGSLLSDATGNTVAKAIVDNRSLTLLPGMVCKARIENTGGGYTIVVPQGAIQISGQDKFVWTVKSGKAHRQQVTTGDVVNEGVIVESGLTTGDMVIIEGQNKVCEDMNVKD